MKKKKENKTLIVQPKVEEENGFKKITYTEPMFNESTQLFEIKKLDETGQVLDMMTDSSEEVLIQRKEDLIKEYILSQINKEKNQNNQKWSGKGRVFKREKGVVRVHNVKEDIIREIIKRKLDGEPLHLIASELSVEFQLKPLTIYMYVTDAMNEIRLRAQERIEDVLEIHISRYEEIYRWLKENGFIKYAGKVLRLKENLLGKGQDVSIGVSVSNFLSVGENDSPIYSLKALDLEEREKFKKLIKKIKEG